VVGEQADCLVSLGGGSMTGLGKARAPYRPSAGRDPHDLCRVRGHADSRSDTEGGRRTTTRTAKCGRIYDVDLRLGLPARLSVVSGLNAMHTASKRSMRRTQIR